VICAAATVGVGSTIVSAALGLGTATIFGALSAIFVAPAVVKELDPWLDRWQLRRQRDGRKSRLARPQPLLIPVIALVGLLALAAPTLGLETGTPDVRLLPESSEARADYEEIQKILGPGFGGVFNVTIQSRDGRPLTTKRSLAEITQLQRAIATDPDIESVFGPAELNRVSEGVPAIERALTGQGLGRLDRGLTRAAAGAREAGEGARTLHAATGEVESGSADLTAGIESAERGSANVAQGVDDASGGSSRLARGAERVSSGSGELSARIADARKTSGTFSHQAEVLRNGQQTGRDQLRALAAPIGSADDSLARALGALDAMTTGRTDPRFRDALEAARAARQALTGADPTSGEQLDPAYAGVAAGIADAEGQFALGLYLSDRLGIQGRRTERGVERLAKGADDLDAGVKRLSASNQRLSDGLGRLATEGVQLPAGLERLVAGAQRLTAGVAQVDAGAGRLSAGIGGAGAGPGQLTGGIEQMAEGVADQRRSGQSERLERTSPGLFDSGLLPLALVDGTRPAARERTQFVLDLSNGGRTAQMTAFPTFTANDPRVGALRERIAAAAERIEGPGLEVAIGGPAALLDDYTDAATDRLPLMITIFMLVSLLILIVAVRAIPLALVCVALNLLTVGVTFGVMQLTFGTDNPLFGGAGYVDVISLGLTLGVVFALSIDYQVFLLGRIREEYRTTGDNERALTAAIGATASVITGAAVVMVAVFLAFCLSSYIGIRQMGVGLAVAVFLDATVVRLVLLPAAMRLAGERIWWFPEWLDRRLPNVSL
jgi:RND superfamily putative drug exporter